MVSRKNLAESSVFRSLKEPQMWLLSALGMVYFVKVLFLNHTFFVRDLYQYFLPQKSLLAGFLRAGELPLWNPNLHGGTPLLADISNAVFYPSSLLYALLPTVLAMNVDLALHVVLSSIAAYLLSRSLGLDATASLVAGLLYAYCGYSLSMVNLFVRVIALPYLPLMVLFWHRYLSLGTLRSFLLVAGAGVLQVFAGAPEMVMITWLTLAVWTASFGRQTLRRWCAFLACGILACVLSAAQLFPLVELLQQSPRGEGMSFETWSQWSLPPKRLPELFVAGVLGQTDTIHEGDYWGRKLIDGEFPYVMSLYFGCLGVALAWIGAVAGKVLTAKQRWSMAAMIVLPVVLAMGRFLPGVELVYLNVPWVRILRHPIKILNLALLPMALLAASGLGPLLSLPRRRLRQGAVLASLGALAFLVLCALSLSGAGSLFLHRYFEAGASVVEISRGVAKALLVAAGFLTLFSLVLWLRWIRPAAWQGVALVLILAVDLLSSGRSVNPTAPVEILSAESKALPATYAALGLSPGKKEMPGRLHRLYRAETTSLGLPQVPTDSPVWRYRFHLDILNGYVAHSYSIPVVYHVDFHGLVHRRMATLSRVVAQQPWERRLPLLSAAGARAVIADSWAEGLEPVALLDQQSAQLHVSHNPKVVDAVTVSSTWLAAQSGEDALRAMLAKGFDPRQHAVVEGPEASSTFPCQSEVSVDWKERRATVWDLEVSSTCDSYLVFSESWFPGWSVEVDGQATEVFQANYAFSAVSLPAGNHHIKRRFRPTSLRNGVAISTGVLVLIVLLCSERLRRRRQRAL